MKFSIVTATRNSAATLPQTLDSLFAQTGVDFESIVVDGASTDRTMDVVRGYGTQVTKWVSEPDRGIYDALNKGIRMSTGDIVGVLHSDDFYPGPHVLEKVAQHFAKTSVDIVLSDVVFVDRNKADRVVRYYSARAWHPRLFSRGWMPPHPGAFIRRACYEEAGLYQPDYRIAADYELLIRFIRTRAYSYSYLDQVSVSMRRGGISTRNWRSNWVLNREIVRACAENGLETNLVVLLAKYPLKVLELFRRPSD